jgi:hypothetical protein
VLTARLRKASQVLAEQLAEIAYHSRGVVVIFVMSDHRQKMRPGHGDLHRFACKGRDGFEFVGEAQINIVRYRPSADRRRMEDVDVIAGDGLGASFALKRRNFVPEMIEHRVGRGVAIVPAPVHFASGDDIDAGDLLLKDCGLGRAQLSISEVTFRELVQSNKSVQGLVPARHAVRAHYGGGVRRIVRHAVCCPSRPCESQFCLGDSRVGSASVASISQSHLSGDAGR